MAPTFAAYARSILAHSLQPRDPSSSSPLSPIQAHNALTARDTTTVDRPNPEKGILHPTDINNKAIFVVFGLLGAAVVCLGIWFFFWAKNGGFYFKENDWDDYKSTVLRRKGPNGTTLSGATTITDLGGGSVYKDLHDDDDDNQTEMTATTGITGITAGVSDIVGREKHRRRREQKEREKERRREEKRRDKDEKKRTSRAAKVAKSPKRKVGEDGAVIDDEAEAEAAEYLRNYRHERPARVGGLNRESDASTWDGSTNPTESSRAESSVTSELMPNRERTPEKKKQQAKSGGGIRKVYSTADKRDSREAERIRAEARKLQEKGRAATAAAASSSGHRRNFSWQRDNTVDEGTAMIPPPTYSQSEVDTHIPGSWAESDVGSDLGTRVYSHVIPGLSSSGDGSSTAGTDVRDYAEERRRNRRSGGGGYRRERQR
ncbi:hypothetical protein N0V82_007920 [Gnomoniopsis sp. IMI 355080]|nr:hypothetical protein N0V82_007920 [Gnomoniopsis sp. IMI 355080]